MDLQPAWQDCQVEAEESRTSVLHAKVSIEAGVFPLIANMNVLCVLYVLCVVCCAEALLEIAGRFQRGVERHMSASHIASVAKPAGASTSSDGAQAGGIPALAKDPVIAELRERQKKRAMAGAADDAAHPAISSTVAQESPAAGAKNSKCKWKQHATK